MRTKKEVKEEYKQLKFKIGVLQLRNTVSGKIWISSSVNLEAIRNRHRMSLNFGMHNNADLQRDWTELGEDKFVFEILSELEQKDDDDTDHAREVKQLEEMYLEELQPYGETGYNKRPK